MFFPYITCVVLVSLALYGLWQLTRDVWQAWFQAGLEHSFRASLLLVVRNSQEQIEGMIRSLLLETAADRKWCELVVVDHASEDITPSVLDRLAAADPWIKVVHLPAAARPAAEGIALCQGELICVLDFINRLRPDEFPAVLQKLRQF
ncbi:MAG: glycosyltransferase [Negativicutes bacterium]|nr:glycosyltransferase [Negativicutes bacterium]MDR3589752.1 glycosyltransferase [Negativicutes bacterium]